MATSGERPYDGWPFRDRRARRDRRDGGFGLRHLHGGTRQAARRSTETGRRGYVDRHRPSDVALVLSILALNVADAVFTLRYLALGGTEANPIAQGMLDLGPEWFLAGKGLMVAVCLAFLLAHKRFQGVRPALRGLFLFYFVLLYYHLFLVFR